MKHLDAIELFRRIDPSDGEIKKNTVRLGEILSIKSRAEYSNSHITENDAREAVKKVERLFSFVQKKDIRGCLKRRQQALLG
ncbi:MAG: HEPN domain-containing protein [Candidatus Thermoplasmatota archaeon]|nr:HEPN domain-containing protein [Candidatus Thermoplasmatota archaeon]